MKLFSRNMARTPITRGSWHNTPWRGVVLALILAAGCGPTYPKERVISELQRVCREEKNISVQAQLVGTNMVVFMPLDELFDIKLDIVPAAIEKIEDVVQITSRVIFSSDAKIEFYTLVVADVATTGAELVWIRYVDDIHRLINGWISREEYRKRVVWQITFSPERLSQQSFDFAPFASLTLPKFLARELTQRVNVVLEDSSYRAKVKGEYAEPFRELRFSLVVADDATFRRVHVPVIMREVADVMRQYRFKDFDFVVVQNVYTKESVTVGQDRLAGYLREDIRALLRPKAQPMRMPAS